MTSDRSERAAARNLGVALLAVTALAFLAGCGDDGDTESGAAATTTAAPADDATTETTTSTDESADTDVDDVDDSATSKVGDRVVVLGEEYLLADVLSLGIQPIASTAAVEEVGFQGLDEYDTSDIEVLPMTTLSLEYLASLRPDTLITLQFWADQVDADVLAGMGDLIILPDGLPVGERLPKLGELTGHPKAAAKVVDDFTAAQDRANEAVGDDCVVSLVAVYPGPAPAVFVDGPWEIPTSILSTGCKLDPDSNVAEGDANGRVYLSMEQISIIDAPRIVMLQSSTVEGEDDAVAQIEADPLWKGLPAVKAGAVTVFDRLGYPGVTGQIRFLDEFAALFS